MLIKKDTSLAALYINKSFSSFGNILLSSKDFLLLVGPELKSENPCKGCNFEPIIPKENSNIIDNRQDIQSL